jgi:hypothetical protein
MKMLVAIVALTSVLAGWAQYASAASDTCIPTSQATSSSNSSDRPHSSWHRGDGGSWQ